MRDRTLKLPGLPHPDEVDEPEDQYMRLPSLTPEEQKAAHADLDWQPPTAKVDESFLAAFMPDVQELKCEDCDESL